MADRQLRRAVFLDRDGTICEEVGYMNHISRLHIYPFVPAAIRRLNDAGLPVVVVTNQSGAGRGFFPEALVSEIHERIHHDLAVSGARIDAFYACPHRTEEGCECRKPRTGMLARAAREHALVLPGSWVVGDRQTDVDLAHNASARSIFVLTGYGRGEYQWHSRDWLNAPEFVEENLATAVDKILEYESAGGNQRDAAHIRAVTRGGAR